MNCYALRTMTSAPVKMEIVKNCVYGMIFSAKKSSHTHNFLQSLKMSFVKIGSNGGDPCGRPGRDL